MPPSRTTLPILAASVLLAASVAAKAATNHGCSARSGTTVTPVLELYTSEGCSSCPPADRWLSALRRAQGDTPSAVIQAFHVGYWDYIGWVDRFAHPSHTVRQRQIARWNRQRAIYTPQAVLDGRDWRGWRVAGSRLPDAGRPAPLAIVLRQHGPDHFEAEVTGNNGQATRWAAYWTVTEHGHQSNVRAGENAGEFLRHDYVVRQYVPLGQYESGGDSTTTLTLRAVAATPGHPRQVNLVLYDPRDGATLQAATLSC